MKHRLFGAVLLVVSLSACAARSPLDPSVPPWVATLIGQLQSQPVANPPASITRYEYKGQTVYYLSPRCCDVWSTLYNAEGTVLCHPDGGITGNGDGLCPDFASQRRNEQLVWRDTRA